MQLISNITIHWEQEFAITFFSLQILRMIFFPIQTLQWRTSTEIIRFIGRVLVWSSKPIKHCYLSKWDIICWVFFFLIFCFCFCFFVLIWKLSTHTHIRGIVLLVRIITSIVLLVDLIISRRLLWNLDYLLIHNEFGLFIFLTFKF